MNSILDRGKTTLKPRFENEPDDVHLVRTFGKNWATAICRGNTQGLSRNDHFTTVKSGVTCMNCKALLVKEVTRRILQKPGEDGEILFRPQWTR